MDVTPPAANPRALPRKRIVATLCGLGFAEWVLFELLRTPYRPPHDMLTFLGTEKYGVIMLMVGMLILGAGLVGWWAVRSVWTAKDMTVVVTVLAVLLGAGVFVFFHPGRPVTPFNLLLR
jgi:Na+/H+-dicarboxylate symporter